MATPQRLSGVRSCSVSEHVEGAENALSCVHQHLGAELPLLDLWERIISGLPIMLGDVSPSLPQLKEIFFSVCFAQSKRPFLDKRTVARNLPFC